MLDQHVVAAIPIDLTRVVSIGKPVVRARYEFAEVDAPGLGGCLDAWVARLGLGTLSSRRSTHTRPQGPFRASGVVDDG
jgi:hypothetical protein